MNRWLRHLLLALMALLGTATATVAGAHEMSIAEMDVRETARGEFIWSWTATDERVGNQSLAPQWPDGCRAEGSMLRCGAAGLVGSLAVDGVGKRYSAAIVKIYWLDGQMRAYTLTGSQPTVQLYGAADDRRGMTDIAWAYAHLGVEHILSGYDHLMFVMGLLFLVGFNKRLVWTITAFTAAHSLTLASSALGLLTLRPPPVEATIALSIMLVAGEVLRDRDTLARRWPALVAFLFGLVHGLGFAGALKDIGLPDNHLSIALLTFNLGVEAGQLMAVAAAWLLYRAARNLSVAPQARLAAVYGIGIMAAYWSCQRIAAILA
jgi:hydrogenase/urease accessory protein HupE